jgi:putative CocE/NonD family hydrolase
MTAGRPTAQIATLFLSSAIGVAALPGWAQAQADDRRPVTVQMGVKIPMRDGVNLSATIFAPQDQPPPLPVILHFTPYIASRFSARALWFARRGYVVAAVDVRGRGNSEGHHRPFVDDGRDGHDVVEWLARHPWSNGKVAMIGGSYTGWDQWSVMKEFPPHLETIVPAVSTYPGTEGIPKNRNIFLLYTMHWLNTVSGVSEGPSFDDDFLRGKWYEVYRRHLPFRALDSVVGNLGTEFQTMVKHPAVDSFWDATNPTTADYARIDKPVLTITGHYDADQTGAMLHYRRHLQYAAPTAREKHYLVIGPWDHSGSQRSKRENAGLVFGPASLIDNNELHKQWYDWTMKNGAKPDLLQKRVAYYVMGAEQWKYADSLEAIPTTPLKLYLDAPSTGANDLYSSGILGPKPPSLSASDQYVYNPLDTRPGEFEMEQGREYDSYNIMGTNAKSQRYAISASRFSHGLIYHSQPFPESTELTGYVKLVAWISMNVRDTDFMVTLHEVTPDGTSIQLTDDALRARYRESPRNAKLVTPGEVTRYDFNQFWFFSRQIAKGSRLRLVFWSPNSIYFEKNYNSGGVVADESGQDAKTAHVTLHHDARYQSYLEIPVVTATRNTR